MSKKVAIEEKINEYFATAPLGEAILLLRLAKNTVDRRVIAAAPPVPVKVKKTVVRRTKAQIEAAAALNSRSKAEATTEAASLLQ